MPADTRDFTPVAIVGVSALFPGSVAKEGFWNDILAGRDLVGDVPPSHWLIEDYYDPNPAAPDKTYGRRGAFLPWVEFNPMEFAVPPSNLSSTDTCQLLALIVAKQVLEDAAGGQFSRLNRDRISVILGVASTTELVVEMSGRLQRPIWVKALREAGLPEDEVQAICDRISSNYAPWTESTFPGLLGNVVAGRIANRFDLGGTNCVIDAACASSLSALHLGLLELQAGSSDLVITGGVDTLNDILMYECFSKTPALSPSGDCRPFSASADGTILGEGLGMFALRRLADAERDGDRIYAVVRGLGTSSDGQSKSVYAPVSAGQAKAMKRTYEQAGYSPGTVELVEAHGTATNAGDAAEFEGLRMVYGEADPAGRQWCALGSVKSQIGHTKAAAGSAGLFKAVMALRHGVLPPTIKVEQPNPKLDLATSPFYLNTTARPWVRGSDHPRRASVSSFGFGGSNYHVALEEYTGPGRRPGRIRTMPSELVLLSAPSAAELTGRCRSLAGELGAGAEGEGSGTGAKAGLSGLARRAQAEFSAEHGCRLALVVSSRAALERGLAQAVELLERRPEESFALPTGVYYGAGPGAAGQLAFLCAGQGSQYLNMGADLAMAFDAARAVWDRTADLGFGSRGDHLHDVVFARPAFSDEERAEQSRRLTRTEWAQPAIGAVSLAQLAVLRELGLTPDCVAGHSFGEVTALCVAGALEQDPFLRIARRRGELMAEAAASVPGAMTAVLGADDELADQVRAAGIDVTMANHNTHSQWVFSGTVPEIERLERWIEERGLTCRRLPVSTAFHSPLVSPSVEPFRAFLKELEVSRPAIPVYANATAQLYPTDPDEVREQLARQLAQPVRFADQVEAMYGQGVRTFVEVGPNGTLTALVEQTLQDRPFMAVSLERRGLDGVTSLWHALGRLAAAGVPLATDSLWAGYAESVDPADQKKPAFSVRINGANYGKPYPPPGGAAALPGPNPPRPAVVSVQENGGAAIMAGGQGFIQSDGLTNGLNEVQTGGLNGAAAIRLTPGAAVQNAGVSPDGLASVLGAFQETQRQMAEAHIAYQNAMAQSHMAYLRAMESANGGLVSMLTGQAAAAPPPVSWQPPAAVQAAISWQPPAPVHPIAPPPATAQGTPAPFLPQPTPAAAPAAMAPAPATAPAMPAPSPAPALTGPADLTRLLLSVVAEKTGYPVEMLDLDLELEAGLGIDSIKRVEILSALKERVPDLPEVQPSELAGLRTLGEIIAFMGRQGQADVPVAVPVAPSPAVTPAGLGSPADGQAQVDLQGLLIAVVAEKTGYPAEMLDLDLELEAGLGIDSIKRVEILSALKEMVPDLPEVQPSELAGLRTLGEICRFMEGPPGAGSAAGLQVRGEAPTAERSGLHRYRLRRVAKGAAGFAMPGLFGPGPILITDDERGVAPVLAERLAGLGIAAQVVREPQSEAKGLICLSGLRENRSADEALAANREALRFARAAAARLSDGGLLITVQSTGGDFGGSEAAGEGVWTAGLTGLARTAAREWQAAAVKAIDLEAGNRTPAELADALLSELTGGGPDLEVGLRADGQRLILVSEPAEAPAGPILLTEQDVVVATGGARGVTAACLEALARAVRPRIALLGRTALADEPADLAACAEEPALKRALLARAQGQGRKVTPAEIGAEAARIRAGREVRESLRALQAAGAEVRYIACDVRDLKQVKDALAGIRRDWGPVTALVHGAGVLADKLIAEKTDEQFDRVLATKVEGLRTLLGAMDSDPLKAVILFSSVAARTGNPGQSDYAAANEILNKLAAAEARRRGPGCAVRALGWGPWESGMVTPGHRAHFERMGVRLISLADGAAAFLAEFRPDAETEVVLGHGAPQAALAGSGGRTWEMEVAVEAGSYPYLNDHRVRTEPVLPVVQVLEWFLRAASGCRPLGGRPAICRLEVVQGVKLSGYGSGRERLRVTVSEPPEGGPLRLELRGLDGRLHYRAQADGPGAGADLTGPAAAAGALPGLNPSALIPPEGLEPSPWSADELYGKLLFHGPAFRAIREVVGLSDAGAVARLVGLTELGWGGDGWLSDPALLDGALQVARLWGWRTADRPSLPTGVEQVILFSTGPAAGPVECRVRVIQSDGYRFRSDLLLLGADGSPLALIQGLDMHFHSA